MKRFLVLLVIVAATSGCYWRAEVQTTEVGLMMNDGVKVDQVVQAGRYSNGGWFAELVRIDLSAKTLEWQDPDLVTRDKQPISLTVGVTYRRSPLKVLDMWNTYRTEALTDAALELQVRNRIPRSAKAVTTQFRLDEMLGIAEGSSRELVQQQLFNILEPELTEVGVELLDVGINDIGVDPDFLTLLKAKAQAQIKSEVAIETTKQLKEQLNQEIAQTDIAVEQAQRQNRVNEELAAVYANSPEFLELERLRLLAGVIGDNDKIYFVPEGSNISIFLGGGGVLPHPITANP